MKHSSILKLQTEHGILEGHVDFASYLEQQVGDLLLHPAAVDQAARDCMLGEVEKVFSEEDNKKLLCIPEMKDVKEVVNSSNLFAAPGTDGIPSLLYSKC